MENTDGQARVKRQNDCVTAICGMMCGVDERAPQCWEKDSIRGGKKVWPLDFEPPYPLLTSRYLAGKGPAG